MPAEATAAFRTEARTERGELNFTSRFAIFAACCEMLHGDFDVSRLPSGFTRLEAAAAKMHKLSGLRSMSK
jgi:hypothetical protein